MPPSAPRASAVTDFDRDVSCVAGLPIDAIDMRGAVDEGRGTRRIRGRAASIATPNLNFADLGADRPEFRGSVLRSDLCLADGMPLVWMARLLGCRFRSGCRVGAVRPPAGPRRAAGHVYFFGGPAGAAAAARQRSSDGTAACAASAIEEAPFAPVEALSSDDMIERINESGADFVIVSLGARKGQAWIERNRGRLTRAGALPPRSSRQLCGWHGVACAAPRCRRSVSSGYGASRKSRRCGAAMRTTAVVFVALLCRNVLPMAWRLRVGAYASRPAGAADARGAARAGTDTVVAERRVDARRPRAAARRADVRARAATRLRSRPDGVTMRRIVRRAAAVAPTAAASAAGSSGAWPSRAASPQDGGAEFCCTCEPHDVRRAAVVDCRRCHGLARALSRRKSPTGRARPRRSGAGTRPARFWRVCAAHELRHRHPGGLRCCARSRVLRHRFWSVVTGADIPLGSRIDGGLLLPHPNGVVIHPHARVGPNCLIFQQVTLGTGGSSRACRPSAGHVDIGAGARILGGGDDRRPRARSAPTPSCCATCRRGHRGRRPGADLRSPDATGSGHRAENRADGRPATCAS